MNSSFKSAIAKLADALAEEKRKPAPDWQAFSKRVFREMPSGQRLEICNANDLTFQGALARAVLSRMTST